MGDGLRVLVVDADRTAAEALRALLERHREVESVWVEESVELALVVLRQRTSGATNTLFVDPFSASDPGAVVKAIFDIRKEFPEVVIALFSQSEKLRSLEGIDEIAQQRLRHYYRLAKDAPIQNWYLQLSEVLLQCSNYLAILDRKSQLVGLRETIAGLGERDLRREAVEELGRAISALEKKTEVRVQAETDSRPLSFPPFVFVEAGRFEKLVLETLQGAARSLSRSSTVHGAVLALGAVILLVSWIYALMTDSWTAVTTGGFGLGGIVAALLTNPMKTIAAEARRLVQIQIAYVGYLSQLQIGAEQTLPTTAGETIERLGKESERTIRLLSEI